MERETLHNRCQETEATMPQLFKTEELFAKHIIHEDNTGIRALISEIGSMGNMWAITTVTSEATPTLVNKMRDLSFMRNDQVNIFTGKTQGQKLLSNHIKTTAACCEALLEGDPTQVKFVANPFTGGGKGNKDENRATRIH